MNDNDEPGDTLRLPRPSRRVPTGGPLSGGRGVSRGEGLPDRTAQQPAAVRARGLLDERYQNFVTTMELRPFELWILAEAIRLGVGHPSFDHAGAEIDSPNIWDLAKHLWAMCYERIKELDE